MTAKVTSEKGKCDYDLFSFAQTYMPTSWAPNVYLGWTSYLYHGQYLWIGYPGFSGATYWYSRAYYNPFYGFGSPEGEATYTKGLLDWSIHRFYYDSPYDLSGVSYCHAYAGTSLGSSYYGAYVAKSSFDCFGRHYDLWSFYGVENGYAELSVDTLSPSTTFDPMMILMDSSTCYMGEADDSFECTYPPNNHECPSYRLPTTKGGAYYALVRTRGNCADPVGEYLLSINTVADPSLTLVNADQPYWDGRSITATGMATVP